MPIADFRHGKTRTFSTTPWSPVIHFSISIVLFSLIFLALGKVNVVFF
jgi:hypothetical protein